MERTQIERLKAELELAESRYVMATRQRDNAWIEVEKLETKLDSASAESIRFRGCLRLVQQSLKNGPPAEALVQELHDHITRIIGPLTQE